MPVNFLYYSHKQNTIVNKLNSYKFVNNRKLVAQNISGHYLGIFVSMPGVNMPSSCSIRVNHAKITSKRPWRIKHIWSSLPSSKKPAIKLRLLETEYVPLVIIKHMKSQNAKNHNYFHA